MESWKAEPDKSRYVFRLRSDVKFHHGAPLELEDVKQSYESFLEVFPFFEKFIDSINIAEAENGIELKLSEWVDIEHLPTPYIIPASYLEDDECYEGTGPYKLTAVEQQKRLQEGLKQPVTLESNNAYFGKLPIIQAVEIHRFGSGVESKDALESGEVDLAYDLDLVEPGKFEVERGHGTLAFYLVLNQSSEICENENVRKALDYAIDRERNICLKSPFSR
jgi:peptide/nickel transport system substrate-binding protein